MASAYIIILLAIPTVFANDRPIIGIVAEEVNQATYPGYSSFIAASYVKAVEQSGARVVPIFIGGTEEYYKEVLNSVNGIVLPGGAVNFINEGGYADAGRIILKQAKKLNNNKINFPILGVCLGFELLVYLEVESYEVLSQCNVVYYNLTLQFKENFRNSQLYGEAPQEVIDILSNENVTFHYHKKCVTEELLNQFNLAEQWKVLSTSTVNLNSTGTTKFISSAEYYKYPFVGIIFHPEKIAYEWVKNRNIPHSKNAVAASRYFYDWLVDEARKNSHSFKSTEEEDSALIYNYDATYVNGYFEQLYLFR